MSFKKRLLVLGMLGILGALLGCREKVPGVEDTLSLENPPPKPPNCSENLEIENITLADGVLADVRILQFGETKLYFPTAWLSGFVDKAMRRRGFVGKQYLERYAPDVHFNECPGVIHRFVGEVPGTRRTTHVIPLRFDGRDPIKNISSDDLFAISLTKIDDPPGPSLRIAKSGGGYNAYMAPMGDILIWISARKDYGPFSRRFERKRVVSQSILDFVEWLKTPPVNRDNDRKFTLSIDGYDREFYLKRDGVVPQ